MDTILMGYPCRPGSQRQRVLSVIRQGGEWVPHQIAEQTGIPRASVSAYMMDFERAGHVERVGERKMSNYGKPSAIWRACVVQREEIIVPRKPKTVHSEIPLCVDFAGYGLDRSNLLGGRIANLAISPLVSLREWPYRPDCGLGAEVAKALLSKRDGYTADSGWMEAAVIERTGLCVWASGPSAALEFQQSGDWLANRLMLFWTGEPRRPTMTVAPPLDAVKHAGKLASLAISECRFYGLCEAVKAAYHCQIKQGMRALPLFGSVACKYVGAGFGGYALYLFPTAEARARALKFPGTLAIEPYYRP